MTGMAASGPISPESQHSGSVRHHGHQVAFCRIGVCLALVLLNFQTKGQPPPVYMLCSAHPLHG